MDDLQVGGQRFTITRADSSDVPAIVALLADDTLGATRESADISAYLLAFREINDDPQQLLLAVREAAPSGSGPTALVATMQLTLIPGLSRGGTKRLLVEAVRIASANRGIGLGEALFEWAHEYGRRAGATLVQLTSDRARSDAHRFYERLGYRSSHLGFKRAL